MHSHNWSFQYFIRNISSFLLEFSQCILFEVFTFDQSCRELQTKFTNRRSKISYKEYFWKLIDSFDNRNDLNSIDRKLIFLFCGAICRLIIFNDLIINSKSDMRNSKPFLFENYCFRQYLTLSQYQIVHSNYNRYQIMQLASQVFNEGDIKKSIQLYTQIINGNGLNRNQALLNRSSAYYSDADYKLSLEDAKIYLNQTEKPSIQGYILFANSLIKTKAIISTLDDAILKKGKQQYPHHKKYQDTLKILAELQITQNQEDYLDKIFEKLLSVPTIRSYMTEQSFLTKVEKMIKNPSLASALIKMDQRLADVQEIILMADQ